MLGNNADGQLGDGTTTSHNTPTLASEIQNVCGVDARAETDLRPDANARPDQLLERKKLIPVNGCCGRDPQGMLPWTGSVN